MGNELTSGEPFWKNETAVADPSSFGLTDVEEQDSFFFLLMFLFLFFFSLSLLFFAVVVFVFLFLFFST